MNSTIVTELRGILENIETETVFSFMKYIFEAK